MNFLKFISLCLIFINVELESKAVNDLIVNVEILNQTNSPLTTVTNKEPDLKWLETKDLIELVSYLMHQEKSNTTTQSNILIDSRDSNEYNGWKSFQNNQSDLLSFYDEKNGHVSFAHNFDADWIDTVDQNQLDSFLVERFGLTPISEQKTQQPPKDRLIIYDTNILRLEKVKNYLMNKFLVHTTFLCRIDEDEIGKLFQKTNVTTNNIFFQEPFYDMLISPEILNAIIRPNLDEKNIVTVNPLVEYKIFEVGVDNTQDHIPSAVRLNMNELEDSVSRTRKNATEISKLLLDIGIRPNNSEMIILYGNPDPMAAFRAALIMKWMGVKDIRILNGGYHAWISKKLTQETTTNQRLSIKNDQESLIKLYDEQVLNTQLVINYIVDQDYVLDLVKNQELFADQYQLVDVRSHDEYVGENRGFSDLEKEEEVIKKGRIPYAKWGGSGNESNRLQDYRNPDLTMRSGYEILRMWDDLGIDYKNKHLIFYCSNGWRSSEIMFYAELMGLYRISLYDGGWYDWSSNKKNYFQIGDNNDILIAFDNSTSLETNSPFNLTTLTITAITTPSNTFTSTLPGNSTDSFNATILFNTTQKIETQTTLIIENSTTLATTTNTTVNITKTTLSTLTSRNSTLNNSSKRTFSISYFINLFCLFSLIFNFIF